MICLYKKFCIFYLNICNTIAIIDHEYFTNHKLFK
uniref:Uncharacterized protein n=1 Tax=Acrosorium ciliolatum TaxID=1550622 RepID=A0A1Z1M239_9FLOR|nr:hypothetical protein [Acrosorium ciliolatum]ARW59950.1 hypothetical protein [Acrosorium ciliolatum]